MPDETMPTNQLNRTHPLRKLITGQYGLVVTYWIWGILPAVLVRIVVEFVDMDIKWLMTISGIHFVYFISVGIGIFAAAKKYNGPALWAGLARAAVVLGAIHFVLSFGTMAALSQIFQDTEERAATDIAQQYDKNGVRFRYPGNWRVTEDTETPNCRYIIIASPGDAIAIIQLYPSMEVTSIEQFARNFADTAKQETSFGTISDSQFGPPEQLGGYLGVTEQFSISVLGATTPHVRFYRCINISDTACFMIGQMAVEDQASVACGFEQVLASFAYGSP